MLKYLDSLPRDQNGKLMSLNETQDEKSKFNIYMKRLQKDIDKTITNLKYVCEKYPELFLNEDLKYLDKTAKKSPNSRILSLMTLIHILNPSVEPQLIRKNFELEIAKQNS